MHYLVKAMALEDVSNPATNMRRAFEIKNSSISSAVNIFFGAFVSIFASASN
jgi:hypothetical protein